MGPHEPSMELTRKLSGLLFSLKRVTMHRQGAMAAAAVHADKGDDSRANRAYLRRRGIRLRIARRGTESSTRLGGTAGGSSGHCRG
jgi:hypothetical protein